jgi:hypothetical protein
MARSRLSPRVSSRSYSDTLAYSIKAVDERIIPRMLRKPRGFHTRDNGGRAFRVKLTPKTVKVSRASARRVLRNINTVWLGCGSYADPFDQDETHYAGNAVLVIHSQSRVCTLIASRHVTSFTLFPRERVLRFVSTVQNSGVPYGFTETNLRYIGVADNNCGRHAYVLKSEYGDVHEDQDMMCMQDEDSRELDVQVLL